MAPENIEVVDLFVVNRQFSCPVETKVGNVTSLPYEDNHFDLVWCANITQYLTDDELSNMLAEFYRVVRPGGLVAVKELDLTTNLFYPIDPTMLWRLYDKARHQYPPMQGNIRTIQLPAFFKKVRLVNVRFKTFLSERKAPLRPIERAFFGELLQFHARVAESVELPEEDMVVWREMANLESPNHILKHPEFYLREGHLVVTGQSPIN